MASAQGFGAGPSILPAAPMFDGYPASHSVSEAQIAGRNKKYTCKVEVGIENEGEFKVGSRVIAIARQIWHDPQFQETGGKTRLRGKGVGGPHEADEPLALCISCRDATAFNKATQHAEQSMKKVHHDYAVFCRQKGWDVPELEVKVTK